MRTIRSYWDGLVRPDALRDRGAVRRDDRPVLRAGARAAGDLRAARPVRSARLPAARRRPRWFRASSCACCTRSGSRRPTTPACAAAARFDEHGAWLDLEAGGLGCERCYGARGDAHALDADDVANFRALGAERGCGRGAARDAARRARRRRPRSPGTSAAGRRRARWCTNCRDRRQRVTVLALDVGTRRIGVAVGEGSFAFPHATIDRTNVRDDVDAIVALARERGARTIVVGDPLTMAGERALASEQIDAFVAHLARAFDGTIERIDERLTTAAAQKALIAADVSRAKRKQVVDQLAAVGILETWLARKLR